MKCHLYRHFDAEGRLLYVGVSACAWRRLSSGHRRDAPWFQSIVRVEIESFETRKAALGAEAEAIVKECPKFNIISGYMGKSISFGFRLPKAESARFERWIQARGITRSAAIRELIQMAPVE